MMGHGHHHAHHHHTHGANKKTLTVAFWIIAAYMIVEAIGGLVTNSLALLSDAGHMLSDAVSLGVGVLAFKFGEKMADYSRTYGYRRIEILAAVFNGVTLIIISIFIFIEAIQRFVHPPEISSHGMLGIAAAGLAVNVLVAFILMRGGNTHDNLNMRAAFLHVIGDMLGSAAAILAAVFIMFFDWKWMDPLASIIVACIIIKGGYQVTKEAVHVLMEGTPTNVNINDVISLFNNTPGIIGIHDLHVWSITSGQNALSCHAVVEDHLSLKEIQHILKSIEHELLHMGIAHMTVQIEDGNHVHEDSVLCKNNGIPHHHHH